jgi:cyanophycinase-like exopeptidase
VIGRGSVTIVDGSDVVTNAFQTTGHKPMMVSNARLHSLPSGYRFDLRARRVLPLVVAKNEHIAQLAQGRVRKMVRRLEDRKASE